MIKVRPKWKAKRKTPWRVLESQKASKEVEQLETG